MYFFILNYYGLVDLVGSDGDTSTPTLPRHPCADPRRLCWGEDDNVDATTTYDDDDDDDDANDDDDGDDDDDDDDCATRTTTTQQERMMIPRPRRGAPRCTWRRRARWQSCGRCWTARTSGSFMSSSNNDDNNKRAAATTQ